MSSRTIRTRSRPTTPHLRCSTTSSAATGRDRRSVPEKESEIYEKFAAEHPDGPRTAQALYQAVYRQAVLKDMYAAEENDKKSEAAHGACARSRREIER